jgi:RimJ/RimL family protein N-acetyltransferase
MTDPPMLYSSSIRRLPDRQCVELCDAELALRPLDVRHGEALAQAALDPQVIRYFYEERELPGRGVSSYAWVSARSTRWMEDIAAEFAVVEHGTAVGWISLYNLNWELGHGTVGGWAGSRARGRGLAWRALSLVCAWGFDELALARIQIQADVDNVPSLKAATRVGFSREGVLRSWKERDGRRVDQAICSLLPGELIR